MRQVIGTGRRIAWSALVVLTFLGASQSGRAQDAPPPPVTVAKPVVKDVVEYDDFIGRFEPVDQVDIRARVSGYVDKIHFTDGSVVKTGDLLFTIDQRPYQAALDEAQASLESAKARVDFAQGDVVRAENLRKSGNITGQIYDERTQTLATAQADVNRAEATLNRAKLDLQFTEIRAPIAGRMSRHLVSLGNLVSANDTVLSNIVSMDPIDFYFDVDERSFLAYQKLSTGSLRTSNDGALNEVLVATSDENEPTHKGRLDFTDNRLDNSSGTIRARAILDNKDLTLVPGLFGRIRILGSDKYKGVLVPEDAIGSDQDRRVVYVVGADNTISLQPVRVGSRVDGYRVIRVGLKGDETIVVNGLMRVRPGIKVDPKLTTLPPVAMAAAN
ncbi:efflux RND transporter periplasmic adaptor subunit [Labrys okinawensis]|uniref:efflux RND transporter periplasmic adaptor subunit n=1 Tax=Labrys okinawensis TaxID=346911 RepID=UPI0039BD3401